MEQFQPCYRVSSIAKSVIVNHLFIRSYSADADFGCRPCSRLKNVGTKKSVETVAKSRPPITARPKGAFCSPPSPSPSAIGTIPMIMASAVIRTGRKRVKPACMAADRTLPLIRLFPGKAHDQNAVRSGDPHAHDRPHKCRNAQG